MFRAKISHCKNVTKNFSRAKCLRAKMSTRQKWPCVQKSRCAKVSTRAKESPCKSDPTCKSIPSYKSDLLCKRVAVQKSPLVQKCQLVQKSRRAKVFPCAKVTLEQKWPVPGLSTYALKLPFVGKVRKIDTAKSFTAQRLRHCRLIVRF